MSNTNNIKPGSAVMNYPGAKARLAPWIIDHLPAHNTYVELFGGSAGVLVQKPESINEIYNDLDGDLVQFFRVLRDQSESLLAWLRRTPYSRELYEEFADEFYAGDRPRDPIERAGRFWYLRQAGFNGKLRERQPFSTSTSARGYPCDSQARNYHRSRERLEAFADRFEAVTIECLDYGEIIDRYDSDTTVFYADPPYVDDHLSNRYYSNDEFDHARLAEQLSDIDGEAVVSYEAIPDAIPDDWMVLERDRTSTLSRGNTEEKNGVERLLLTFAPTDTPLFAGSDGGQTRLGEVSVDG